MRRKAQSAEDVNLKRGVFWSLLVHGTLLALLLLSGLGSSASGRRGGGEKGQEELGLSDAVSVEILPPESKDEPSLVEVDEYGLLAKAPHAGDDCASFYGGVGVSVSYDGYVARISEVPEGYPAARAGVEPWDEPLNFEELRGKIGTEVTIKVRRGSREIAYTVFRDKICTREPDEGDKP